MKRISYATKHLGALIVTIQRMFQYIKHSLTTKRITKKTQAAQGPEIISSPVKVFYINMESKLPPSSI